MTLFSFLPPPPNLKWNSYFFLFHVTACLTFMIKALFHDCLPSKCPFLFRFLTCEGGAKHVFVIAFEFSLEKAFSLLNVVASTNVKENQSNRKSNPRIFSFYLLQRLDWFWSLIIESKNKQPSPSSTSLKQNQRNGHRDLLLKEKETNSPTYQSIKRREDIPFFSAPDSVWKRKVGPLLKLKLKIRSYH